MRKLALVLCAPVLLLAASASAHFALQAPPSTKGDGSGKGAPPCGPDTTDGTATPVTGGSMLPITINETVRHGGFYRIALSLKNCKMGADCFPADNKVYDKNNMLLSPDGPGTSDHADYDMNPTFPILADNLFPHNQTDNNGNGETYMGSVAIPNVNCDRCTLQVIEFMAPHGPNVGGGYFYHHCADLKITADAGKPIFDPNNPGGGGTGGGGSGGSAGAAGSGGAATAGSSTGGAAGTGVTAGGGSNGGSTSASSGSGGTGTTTAGTGTTAAGGTSTGGTSTAGSGTSGDDGGCGIAHGAPGGASALAALGLLLGLVRRRRSR
ncbi:MAG TPA: SCE4755 family polysaccharide monooxygenase-like protein [Polyangiaceae bacterium]|nr:SCE4755 family polysaccharide monooxygenase-like protein [Polyangiaceae bacterium]